MIGIILSNLPNYTFLIYITHWADLIRREISVGMNQ